MTHEFVTNLVWFIPLPPVIAFALIVLFTNKSKVLSHTVAISAAFLSWLGAMIVFWNAIKVEHFAEEPFASSINWLSRFRDSVVALRDLCGRFAPIRPPAPSTAKDATPPP